MKRVYLIMMYAFFYIPIAVLVAYSFNNTQYSLLWHGFTTKWYQQLFQDHDLWIATGHSFLLGMMTATLSTFLGLITSVALYRYHFLGKKIFRGLVFILILSPEIVMGTTLLILFRFLSQPLGFTSLLLAHVSFCVPFVIVTLYSRLLGFDKNIFEAAKDLGANDTIIFKRIILPLLAPALIAGWLLSFTLSLDDVVISYFIAGPEFQILPLMIYSMVRSGVKPEINALCSVLFSITLFLVILAESLLRKRNA